MYKVVICFFLILVTISCSYNFIEKSSPRYVIVAEEITSKAAQKLAAKHNMHVCGSMGGMMDRVNLIGISFEVFHPLTQGEARELVVDCMIEFSNEINSNEEIQPYLVSRPFPYENIEIGIFSRTSDYGEVYHPFINYVFTHQGKVRYVTLDPENRFNHKSDVTETFDEALATVNSRTKR